MRHFRTSVLTLNENAFRALDYGADDFDLPIEDEVTQKAGATIDLDLELGSRAPLSWVVVYRSPSPRTETYFPLSTVTPLTRETASPASSSGPREISSREMALLASTRSIAMSPIR